MKKLTFLVFLFSITTSVFAETGAGVGRNDPSFNVRTVDSPVWSGTHTFTFGITANEGGTDSDTRIEGDNNANLLFIDAGNDRIGIGVSAPNTLFEVGSGTFNVLSGGNIGIGNSAPSTLFEVGADTFNVLSGGNVGVGTSAPAYKLEVSGDIGVTSGTITNRFLIGSGAAISTMTSTAWSLDDAYKITVNGSDLSGPTNSGTVASIRFQPNTGNKLTLLQLAPLGSGTRSLIEMYDSETIGSTTRVILDNNAGVFSIGGDGANKRINIVQTNSVKTTFDTDGNVGIGTSSPDTLLHLSSGAVTIDGNVGTNVFKVNSTTFVVTDGNIGIGTSAPSAKLHMSSGTFTIDGINPYLTIGTTTVPSGTTVSIATAAGNNSINIITRTNAATSDSRRLLLNTSDSNSVGQFSHYSTLGIVMGSVSNEDVYIRANDDDKIRIANGGNVGIGYVAADAAGKLVVNGNVGIGNSAPSAMFVVDNPTAQTIAAGNTITADACGTLKLVTSGGAVTTDTTNTFTAPAAGNKGCIMYVCNSGGSNITLDNNANFKSAGAADVVLGADDCLLVGSTGASGVWYQLTALEAN